jgi:hypothetical protein
MYPLIWLDYVNMTSPALLNDRYSLGILLLINDRWQLGVLLLVKDCWQLGNIVSINTRWPFGIHVSLNVCWQLGDNLLLNRNNRVISFCWTNWSKLCFLTSPSNFCCYFLILVLLQNCYLLFFCAFLGCTGIQFLVPFSCTFWHSKVVRCTCTPMFWHRMRGFLKGRHSREPGSRLTTGDLFPFRLLPRFLVQMSVGQMQIIPYSQKSLSSTFSRDISPAK